MHVSPDACRSRISLRRSTSYTRDHQRAKNPEQRNEIYAKLHKMKRQLEELQGQ